jgi:putative oxidoreductase
MMNPLTAYAGLNRFAERIGDKLHWLGPSLARLTVGLVFAQSGWGKLNNLGQVSEYFTELGLPMPAFQALLASSTELVGGLLLLAGLATRFAALPLVFVMMVAIRTALWDQVDGFSSLTGMIEFLYIVILAWIALAGAGPLSLDALLLRERRQQATGLLVPGQA